MTPKFWLVWCPEKGKSKVRHESKADAIEEAERIASLSGVGTDVFVLEVVGVARRPEPPAVYFEVVA